MGETVARRVGAWMALAAMPALTWVLVEVAIRTSQRTGGAFAVEAVVTTGLAAGGAAISAYFSLVSLAIVLAAATRQRSVARLFARFAPGAWRRVAVAALGATLATTASVPALAQSDAPSPVDWAATEVVATAPAADQEPLLTSDLAPRPIPAGAPGPEAQPDPNAEAPAEPSPAPAPAGALSVIEVVVARGEPDSPPVAASPASEAPAPAPSSMPTLEPEPLPHDETAVHVVSRGESLWSITAGILGPDASNAEIAQAWPLVYAENTDFIGPDPGLIFAGQALSLPESLR